MHQSSFNLKRGYTSIGHVSDYFLLLYIHSTVDGMSGGILRRWVVVVGILDDYSPLFFPLVVIPSKLKRTVGLFGLCQLTFWFFS
jgi:hypothetical protein